MNEKWRFYNYDLNTGEPVLDYQGLHGGRRSDATIAKRRNTVPWGYMTLLDTPHLYVRIGTTSTGEQRIQLYVHDDLVGETPSSQGVQGVPSTQAPEEGP